MATGISETTAQADAMLALVAAARVALAGEEADIGYGFRWPIVNRDWFHGQATSSTVDPKTIGPRHAQDETITLTVTLGTWAPPTGDPDDETEAGTLTRAFELLGKVNAHIRNNDITLGGTVLWCLPGSSTSETTSDLASGIARVTEIVATFVCSHRIAPA